MATIVKQEFSGSTDGRPIQLSDSAMTTIHAAQAGNSDNNYDEIWAWATNVTTGAVSIEIEFGNTASSDNIFVTIPPKEGLMQIIPGLVLNNSATFKAQADAATAVNIVGYVNKITS